jgi:hypothetical protein
MLRSILAAGLVLARHRARRSADGRPIDLSDAATAPTYLRILVSRGRRQGSGPGQ